MVKYDKFKALLSEKRESYYIEYFDDFFVSNKEETIKKYTKDELIKILSIFMHGATPRSGQNKNSLYCEIRAFYSSLYRSLTIRKII